MSEEAKDGFGLDKKARAIAKRLGKDAEQAKSAAALDPPFPYVMRPFDPSFFEI